MSQPSFLTSTSNMVPSPESVQGIGISMAQPSFLTSTSNMVPSGIVSLRSKDMRTVTMDPVAKDIGIGVISAVRSKTWGLPLQYPYSRAFKDEWGSFMYLDWTDAMITTRRNRSFMITYC